MQVSENLSLRLIRLASKSGTSAFLASVAASSRDCIASAMLHPRGCLLARCAWIQAAPADDASVA